MSYPLSPSGFSGVFTTLEGGGKKEGRLSLYMPWAGFCHSVREGMTVTGRGEGFLRNGTILGRFGNIWKGIKQEEEEIYLLQRVVKRCSE